MGGLQSASTDNQMATVENNLIGRIREAIVAGLRSWKAGPGVVEHGERDYGHDESTYSPAEYGNYLSTSNPVYTCTKIRSDALASVPIKAYKYNAKGKKVLLPAGPVTKILNKVNDYWTMNRLLHMTEMSLCTWGKAYWAVERGPSTRGAPTELWWMRPDQVTVYPDPVKYVDRFTYDPMNGEDPIEFQPWEIIWFRYPNPMDEYGGLPPMVAARLAADIASSAGKSNKKIFDNGYQLGGIITPKEGLTMTEEQSRELEKKVDARFKGVDRAHRWGVFRFQAEMKELGVTPKDAEYLGALAWSLEDVGRAYGIPLDMIGGQRTYENVKASDRAFWMRTMIPECKFITSEIIEQLLPMFGSQAPDLVEFDLRKVEALQDDEGEVWTREQGQIQCGAIKINEWRESKGMEPVPWGDVWWTAMTNMPAGEGGMGEEQSEESSQQSAVSALHEKRYSRGVVFGSDEHKMLWRKIEKKQSRWEEKIGKVAKELFERQRESIKAKLKKEYEGERHSPLQGNQREIDPFDLKEWIKKLRGMIRVVLEDLVDEVGQDAIDELSITMTFDISLPEVARFIERRAQRFAQRVNKTTWDALKTSLAEGLDAGEGLEKLEERVDTVMGDRIRSSKEVIARTETVGAMNGGTLQGWKQSGIVEKKAWLCAMDGRERESHRIAHERYQNEPIDLEDDFEVGAGRGPAPGQIGIADEDIQCRCSMVAMVNE
jgi:HK97 family phage portal protein